MRLLSIPGLRLTIAGVALASSPAAIATEVAAQPAEKVIKTDVIGCKDKSVRARLTALRDSGDREAFNRFGQAAFAAGQCRELKQGETVYLEIGSMIDYICLRPKGLTSCYWTFSQGIR